MNRALLLFVGLLAACVTLYAARERARGAGGLGAGAAEVVELTFWNGFTGPDGRVMLGLVRKFNEENPDVRVMMQRLPWGTYYNKLMVAAVDDRGPEVFVVQSGMMTRMARAGFLEEVEVRADGPIDEALLSDIDKTLLDRARPRGEEEGKEAPLLGVPLDVWPQGMFLNAEMLREAGWVKPDGSLRIPTRGEEFIELARAMRSDVDGDGVVETWGFAISHWQNNFMTIVPQFGGRLEDERGRPTLDDAGNVAALEWMVSLFGKHEVAPSPEGGVAGWVGFRQRRVGMVFDGIYMLGDLKRLEGHPYVGAAIPQMGPQRGTLADSHVLSVRRGLGERERQAAWRFVRFLSDHGVEWSDAGQVPARRSVRESEAFARMQVQNAFAQQLDAVMYPPKTPSIAQLTLKLGLAVEQALRERKSPAEALGEAQRDYLEYLERDARERRVGRADSVDASGGSR